MEQCFGRRARRAAHVSDPRRSILRSGGGGRTLSGDVEPRCSLEHSRAAEAALPDARRTRAASWGQNPGTQEDAGRLRSNFFFLSPGFAGVRRRPRRSKTPGETSLGCKKVAQSQMQMLNRLAHGADRNVAPEPTSPRGREKTRSERG